MLSDAGVSIKRCLVFFFFQAEDGIRDLVRSRGLGDVYKRQLRAHAIRALQIGDGRACGIVRSITR